MKQAQPNAGNTAELQGRITRERAWDDHGMLLRDDEVFADGSHKAYSK